MSTLDETRTALVFTVYGKPQPAGSKRAFVITGTNRASVTDANPKSRDWKNAVASEAYKVHAGDLLDGPLAVQFTFYFPRPKGHYRTGKNIGQLKPSSPMFPATKPDALKLARGVEDALSGVVYRDDAQIVQEVLAKRFGEPARVEIIIEKLHV